jgi:cell wall-associated NlpC family hydrolase
MTSQSHLQWGLVLVPRVEELSVQVSHLKARRRGVAVVASISVAAGVFGLSAAQAEPDVTKADVEAVFAQAERANEQVNQLRVDIRKTQRLIDDLSVDIDRRLVQYRERKQALGDAIAQQQLDSPLGATASLLGSANAEEFLDGLGAVQALNTTRADSLAAFDKISQQLDNRRAQLDDHKATLVKAKKQASKKRAVIAAKYREAKAKLAKLQAAERKEFNTSNTTLDFDPDAKGRAKAAIAFALAQLGEPYVYGGAGPDQWDCSGLVMKAFAAAGVSLPRVVGPQMAAGTSISLGDLQPGDLVAYADMSHIGIYLGNGKVVHAPRPGKSVEITGMSGYTVAARVV